MPASLGRDGSTFDIGVAAAGSPRSRRAFASEAPHEDAGGRLVTPGFVDTHIHLDKSCILDRCELRDGTLQEAIAQVAAAKRAFTEGDIYARGRRTLEKRSCRARCACACTSRSTLASA
jgi:cytosine deaminase